MRIVMFGSVLLQLRSRGRVGAAALVGLALLSSVAVVAQPGEAHARRGGSPSYQIEREPNPGDPLTIVVSLDEQRLKVFDSQGLVATSKISSGTRSNPTPTGVFSVLEKNRTHFSNLYYSAPMPNMQRLTWSGIALHAGDLPGYPASHGCIRLPHAFSKQLFAMTRIGTRVIVDDELVEPQSILHPRLFTALPPGEHAIPKPVRRPDTLGVRSAAAGVGSVSALLGVTPAAAAEAAIEIAKAHDTKADTASEGPQQRTRAIALAERQQVIDDLAAAVAAREKDFDTATQRVDDLSRRLKDQQAALRRANSDLQQLERDVRRAEGAVTTAQRDMQTFVRVQQREIARAKARAERRQRLHEQDGASKRSTASLLRRAAQREAEAKRDAEALEAARKKERDLEHAILDRERQLQVARAAVPTQANIIAAYKDAVAALTAELASSRTLVTQTRAAKNNAEAEHRRAVAAFRQFSKPPTIMISRATGKLHVRQGFEDVYEAPVTIDMPRAALGTHVFTAARYLDSRETDLDWRVLTVTDVTPSLPRRPRKGLRQTAAIVDTALPPPPTASNALDRIEISEDVRQRITELVKPGSTLIVTDLPISRETGKGTDLIVEH